MEQERIRESINKQPSEEQQETIKEFQTIFSEFKNEIHENQEPLTKETIRTLFESFGKDLRENQKDSYIHGNDNTKINLERVYNYILQQCTTKDPSFTQQIQDHEKNYPNTENLSGQGLYYRRLMILNIFLTNNFGVFFAYNTRHLALTPNPIIEAEQKKLPEEKSIAMRSFMESLGFTIDEKEIKHILVHGKLPDGNTEGMYLANTIFVFENKDITPENTTLENIQHEYVHQCFDKKYGTKIGLQDTIKKDGKEYLMGTMQDGIFGDASRYTTTGLSIQEFLADAIEMKLSQGANQRDLRHKAYNLKEHKVCPIKYRNSIRLITSLINKQEELSNIYEDYEQNLKAKGEKEADKILEETLKTQKINQNGQEISCQEFITNNFYKKTQEIIKVLDNFIK